MQRSYRLQKLAVVVAGDGRMLLLTPYLTTVTLEGAALEMGERAGSMERAGTEEKAPSWLPACLVPQHSTPAVEAGVGACLLAQARLA